MNKTAKVLVALSVFIALFCGVVLAQDETGGTSSTELPVAVQMYTLRDYGTVEEQFRFAADSGYENVETVGTHGLSAEQMNALLAETGLSVISSHVDLTTLRTDLDSVIAFNEAVGNSTVVMPYLSRRRPPPRRRRLAGARGGTRRHRRSTSRRRDAVGVPQPRLRDGRTRR